MSSPGEHTRKERRMGLRREAKPPRNGLRRETEHPREGFRSERPSRLEDDQAAAMFRAMYDQATHFIGILDLDGVLLDANQTACDLIGKDPSDVIGRPFWETGWWEHSTDQQQKLKDAIQRARGGEMVRFEATHRDPSGVLHQVAFSLKPARDASGRIFCLVPEGLDITERKNAEVALQRKTEELDGYFANASELLCIADQSGRFRRVNEEWRTALGYSTPDLVGKFLSDCVHPDDRPCTLDALQRIHDGLDGQTLLNRVRCRDGSYRWIEWRFFPTGDRVCGAGRDVTERKLSEEALRNNTRQLQTIISGAPIIIYSFDSHGVFTLSEGRGLEGMGLAPGEIVGRSVFEVYRDRPDILENMKRALAGETFSAPLSVGTHTFDGYHSPLWDEHGAYTGTIGVLVDTTERTRAELERSRLQEQLQQAMKMEAVGRLAGGVAHDFNNLLTAIMGNAELARIEQPDSSNSDQHLEEIVKAAESAASLTGQLLAFSRRQITEPRLLRLNEVLANLRGMLARMIGEDITLETDLADRIGAVKLDPGQFEQVVVNLAVNARDAMPSGGRLVIATSDVALDERDTARLPTLKPGKFVLLRVTDTGHGMGDDVKRHLFEPFFTTKPRGRGTGLGLATIFGIVKQAGGAIEVTSEPKRGTTFDIYLPATPATPATLQDLQADAPAPELPRGDETILIVEDEPSVREVAMTLLTRLGYVVLSAGDANEAIQTLEGHLGHVDLLMTDVVMPDMNGRALAERLGRLHPEMKVLFTSGYTEDVVLRHGVLVKDLNFLGKPYSIQALARKLRAVLERTSPRSVADDPSTAPSK